MVSVVPIAATSLRAFDLNAEPSLLFDALTAIAKLQTDHPPIRIHSGLMIIECQRKFDAAYLVTVRLNDELDFNLTQLSSYSLVERLKFTPDATLREAMLFDNGRYLLRPGSLIQVGNLRFPLPDPVVTETGPRSSPVPPSLFNQDKIIGGQATLLQTALVFGEVALATNRGVRARANNEDKAAYRVNRDGSTFLMVADGIGGHGTGELAAQIVTESCLRNRQQGAALDSLLPLGKASLEQRFRQLGCPSASKQMGCCAVVAEVDRNSLGISHVGDTRGYLIKKSLRLEDLRRTKDHSYVQSLVDQNKLTEDEVKRHENRNVVTKFIAVSGSDEKAQPTNERFVIESGDYVLLCSDGFWENITTERIFSVLREYGNDLSVATTTLMQDALANVVNLYEMVGSNLASNSWVSDDNITLILYRHG